MPEASLSIRLLQLLTPFLPARFRGRIPVVPVVRLSGAIGALNPWRPGLNLAGLAATLEAAFDMPRIKAVAIVVNSPGGSAVQSHLIFHRIRALAEEKKLPVFAFVEDAAASGGYMLALAGDEIFCDPSSIVGSIGVVAAGFGFDRLIERFGIERRVYTAGAEKGMLDPFQPEREKDIERLLHMQKVVHAHFIELVKTRRAGRLKGEEDMLFTGAFWSGRQAIDLGLVDGEGDVRSIMRKRFGEKVKLKLVERPRGLRLGRLFAFGAGRSRGADAADLLGAIEDRSLWSRYGL
jgi:signal peptide peptidase SppA